jgi:hypothetical protein
MIAEEASLLQFWRRRKDHCRFRQVMRINCQGRFPNWVIREKHFVRKVSHSNSIEEEKVSAMQEMWRILFELEKSGLIDERLPELGDANQ